MSMFTNAGVRTICTRCVLDTTVPGISFDDNGECSYCRLYDSIASSELAKNSGRSKALATLVRRIREKGHGRKFDCIIGVSGGVDSTYLAYLVKNEWGLRALAVHLDNGWDTELAVANIENTLTRLGIELLTYVLDWEEFRDLQVAFLKASIANAEIPTDHAITAALYRAAAEEGVSYIINGANVATEAIMPASWMYTSTDLRLIRAIGRRFGSVELKCYPTISAKRLFYYTLIRRIRMVYPLNYLQYEKLKAKEVVSRELGWRNYGGKHQESIYTRFFQAYLLPRKFNIDKRKAHLSNLILSGQLSRGEALSELARDPCPQELVQSDLAYVKKKLRLTDAQFEDIMAAAVRHHGDFPNLAFLRGRLQWLVKLARSLHYGPKT